MQDNKEKIDGTLPRSDPRHEEDEAWHRQPSAGANPTPSDTGIAYLKAQTAKQENQKEWDALVLKLDDLAFDEGLFVGQKTKERPNKENN